MRGDAALRQITLTTCFILLRCYENDIIVLAPSRVHLLSVVVPCDDVRVFKTSHSRSSVPTDVATEGSAVVKMEN